MEQQYDPLSRTLLKITSILMIVFGVFGLLLYVTALAVLAALGYVTAGMFSGTQDIIGISLLALASLAEFIGGILGVKTLRHPEKPRRCRLWGILTLVLGLAGLVHILLRGENPVYWISIPLSLVTPVLYLMGASGMRNPLPVEEEEEAEI